MIFSRQEVLKLSGLSSKQLSYLDKLGIISPEKIGSGKKPYCQYSWTQLLALRAYAKLRENCSLQTLRDAIAYFKEYHPEELLRDKRLIVSSNKVYWIDDSKEEMGLIMLEILNGKEAQTILPLSFTISELVTELRQKSRENNVVNFEERFDKATKAA